MNHQPLLSVIVPCYNVEKYIDKCIASIVSQTYSNLEILLINDGSSDETGIICSSWQEKDHRIKVIHKQNEGSSYARKTGVEKATAEYVTFVDSDDWIDINMYADMMEALLTTNSDIADCDLCMVYDDGRLKHRVHERRATVKIMGRIESMIMYLEDHEWRTSLGTKIFKKKLFDHVEFPKGRVMGEDMIIQNLYHQVSQTVFVNKAYYFYLQRSDSISRLQGDIRKDLKNLSDFSNAYYECYAFVKQYPEYHKVLPIIQRKTIIQNIRFLEKMMKHPQYFSNEDFTVITERFRFIHLPKGEKLRHKVKIQFLLLKISPKVYKFLILCIVQVFRITNSLKITNKKF